MAILSKFLRRLFNGSSSSVNSNDSGCDVNFGIKQFIECRTGNVVEAFFLGVSLENAVVQFEDGKTVSRKSIASSSSSSSSSSSDGNDDNVTDLIDAPNCSIEHKGAKVMEVNMGSFCHGFGLREDDIILTVNEKPVESADVAICRMERIIARNKNSRLALEIQRKERGLIKLDNGGDDLESVDDDVLHCLPWKDNHTVIRIKNLCHRKYLTVTARNGKIRLSYFRTKPFLTLFKVHQYDKFLETEASVSKYAVIQHKETGKCLWVQDGKLSLMDAPNGTTLPQDSGYLFDIRKLSPPSNSPRYKNALFFDTVTQSTDNAIGFRSKRSPAELLKNTNKKVLFTTYVHKT